MTSLAPAIQPELDIRTRVSLRDPVSRLGYVDAGWWPRSRDLAVELPELLDVLSRSNPDITRIAFSLEFWGSAPRKLAWNGRTLRLGGFNYQDPRLLSVIGSHIADRIEVLVIPPQTDPDVAAKALKRAAESGDADSPAQIMSAAGE